MNSISILEKLIGFPTVSSASNLELIDYVAETLKASGVGSRLVFSADRRKASLFATVGDGRKLGVILSGHSDVVPVEGQDWGVAPFSLTERDGLLFGRGTADMKGFVACALAAMLKAARRNIQTPFHLALSYDEEIGCVGVRDLIATLRDEGQGAQLCIVGEPTSMQVAVGHKGKLAARATCHGRTGHSALAPLALNAMHLGCDFVAVLRETQRRLQAQGARDEAYDIAYSTVHAGIMKAGRSLNIVPDICEIDFEIRNVAGDDPERILAGLREEAESIVAGFRAEHPGARIDIDIVNQYPGLDTPATHAATAFMQSLSGAGAPIKVTFGTEGGLYSRDLDVPVVICGPGSMVQGHKPDEYVSVDQLQRCDAMLERLLEKAAGSAPLF